MTTSRFLRTLALSAPLTVGLSLGIAGAQGLTFWPSSNPEEIEFAKQIVAAWNKANPSTPVKMQPLPASRSSEEVLLAAIAGKTTPDVAANIYPGAISQFVSAGGLYAHNKLPDFKSFMTDRSGADVLEAYTSAGGNIYQIPWKSNPTLLAYNTALLAEAGIKPADLATYSGFLAAARKVKAKWGGKKFLYAPTVDATWWQRFFDFYTLYIAASGGKTLLDKSGKVIFDAQPGQEVFGFLATLFKEGLAPRTRTAANRFFEGESLLETAGPFTLPFYAQNAPKGMKIDLLPPPVPDRMKGQKVYTYGDPKNIAVFTTSKDPALAWKFIKFVLSKNNDALFMKTTGQIPYREGLETDAQFKSIIAAQPLLSKFVRQAPLTRGVDDTKSLVEVFDAISREYESAVVYGRGDPTEAVKRAGQKARDILSGF